MKVLLIITTDDGETIYNAMRLANRGVEKGLLFEKSGNEQYDVMEQMEKFGGDFYA